MGWVDMTNLKCSQGHHVRLNAFPLTDAIVRCKWRHPQGGRAECGRLLYVLACVPARGPALPNLYFVAEVTYKEAEHIRLKTLGVLAALTYLGGTLTTEEES